MCSTSLLSCSCVFLKLEGQAALLRLSRLLRVLKLLKMIEQLQIILRGLARGLTSIGYITMLLFLCFYLFGIIGIMLFKESDPAHFSGLGHALLLSSGQQPWRTGPT